MNSIKQYTNSKGEYLPKVICAVVEFEINRIKSSYNGKGLGSVLEYRKSIIFGTDPQINFNKWTEIDDDNYEPFYSIFPTCKNSRGQELPEEIQVEIVEERLRQGTKENWMWLFDWSNSTKGYVYWHDVSNSDYSQLFIPKCGDMVEVSDSDTGNNFTPDHKYILNYEGQHVTINPVGQIFGWKYCRKIEPKTKVTIAELLSFYATAKGLNVDDLEQI